VFLGFRIFDGVTDPIAGVLSDAWVRRGRERRKLLWFSFLIPPIGLALVFAPTAAMAPALRWTLLCGGMFLFFVGYTFYAIPYWSLIDDYSGGEVASRRALSNTLGAGMLLATGLGFGLSPMLVERLGFLGAALAFGLPAGLLCVLPVYAQPPGAAPPAPSGDPNPLRDFLRALRHRKFVALLALISGSQMSFTVMTAAAPLIAVRLLDGTKGDVLKMLGPFLLTALPFFVAVPWVARRLGWQRALVAASLCLGVVYAGTAFLGHAVIGGPFMTAGLLFALGGPMAAVLLGLEGEAITACAREQPGEVTALYFGVFNLVVKSLNGVAMLLTGLLADAAVGGWGADAVRAMGPLAGGLLALGVFAYWAIRPPVEPPAGDAPPQR